MSVSKPSRQPAPPSDPRGGVADVLRRNIGAFAEVRKRFEHQKTFQERIADGITGFAGSMRFVYLHALAYGGWIAVNSGLVPGLRPFDPFPFVMLAMIASVEAIFLSTFILISQNRMSALADKRADLDLQINLLSEHEVTRLISMVDAVSRHLGLEPPAADHVRDLERDVRPEEVVEALESGAPDKGGG
jgi:uncharacterized membrane protein